jgi:uncharacterized protein DUF4410
MARSGRFMRCTAVGTAMVALALSSACGASRQKVRLEAIPTPLTVATRFSVDSIEPREGLYVDRPYLSDFDRAFLKALSDERLIGGVKSGEYTLKPICVSFDEGNAAKRWLVPGWGSTVSEVKVSILDNSGTEVGTVEATETVAIGGVFSVGADNYIMDRVAKALAQKLAEKLRGEG